MYVKTNTLEFLSNVLLAVNNILRTNLELT